MKIKQIKNNLVSWLKIEGSKGLARNSYEGAKLLVIFSCTFFNTSTRDISVWMRTQE